MEDEMDHPELKALMLAADQLINQIEPLCAKVDSLVVGIAAAILFDSALAQVQNGEDVREEILSMAREVNSRARKQEGN